MVTGLKSGILPLPFPDENCYSLLCRYAVRRSQVTAAQISIELFGNTEPLSGYVFKPFRLRNVHHWLDDSQSPWQFGADHSCYPFYALFLNSLYAETVKSCTIGTIMTSGQAKRINRECGFTRSHKRNLWYCPSCVREDFFAFGETCWRRLPQLPGAVYCPVHREKFRESGVSFSDIQYQLIPASYALMHIPEPEPEEGNVYADRYIRLAEDMAWILDCGFSLMDFEKLKWSFYASTGKNIRQHLFYSIAKSDQRENHFEDYLASKILKDSGKDRIDPFTSKHIGTILSLEDEFGTVEGYFTGE